MDKKRVLRVFKRVLLVAAAILLVVVIGGYIFVKTQMTHHTAAGIPAPVEPTGDAVIDSIRRGVEYLKVHQEPDGHFSAGYLDPKPAFTAMVVDSLSRTPDRYDEQTPFVKRAVEAILSLQKPDGGIYTTHIGLGNYCTSVSIMALESMKNPEHARAIERAKAYVLGCQGEDGGMGYGASGRADLSNTMMSLEALDKAGLDDDEKEALERAIKFIASCQNNSETNTEAWATNDGGFIYRPGESKAGTRQGRGGKTEYVSYGLMSYAGLVSFLWAGVDREDDRVKSAMRWVENNWTLEENRNLGDSGLYYYYMTMAKALAAYGKREIETQDGTVHDWPVELSEKIVDLQRPDGSWTNSSKRWYEHDPVLVTAYMIRTLSICHRVMHPDQD